MLGIQWAIHVEIAAWYDSIMGVREGMSGTRLVVRMEQNSLQQNKCSSNNPVSPTTTLTKEVCYIRKVEQLCADVEVSSLITLLVKVL